MTANSLEAIFPEVIDSTMRNDYISCGQLFNYQRVHGLAPKGGSVHLIAGGAFAKGLEVARRSYYKDGKDEDTSITAGAMAAFEHYGAFEPEDKYRTKSAERVAYGIAEYFCEYPFAEDKIQPYIRADGSPAIEFEFSFDLPITHPVTGNPILFGGRADMVGSYMSGLWVVDEKTATRLGPQWLRSFGLRGQFLGYCYASKLFGLPVNGFVVRGVSFLRDYYGHAEVIQPVADYLVDRWYEQLLLDVQRMVDDFNAGRFNYSLGEACNAYGGCPFKRLCDKEDWTQWHQTYFDVDRWNPLEQRQVDPNATPLVFSS